MATTAETIRVSVGDEPAREMPVGIRIEEILGSDTGPGGLAYMGALVNYDLVSLSFALEVDCTVVPVDLTGPAGYRVYRRSLCYLLAKVMHELYPEVRFAIEHSLGTGFYCTFETNGHGGMTPADLDAIAAKLAGLVEADLPIQRRKLSFFNALDQFKAEEQPDKYNLLQYRNPPIIVVYTCGEFSDLAHGVIAARTGMLRDYALHSYHEGFVIQFPARDTAPAVPPLDDQPELFKIFAEHKRWGRILGLTTVGELNRIIAESRVEEYIRMAEGLHEKKIARIADQVDGEKDRPHVILIAGPSSAGKTTLSKRLMVQLRVNGLRPVTISVDNYFVDRDDTPRDENGEFDFEHIEAIDLAFFNHHLQQLDQGEEIELPVFNFEKGKREFRGDRLCLHDGEILILEGIHCLNPRLADSVPEERKFKIYISALGQLNLDRHNRISTTDLRLLRRMVRDHQFRGHSALRTLQMWPSVRRGEKRWIFPNQKNADIMFNSALEYEMAALKPLAEPMLREVKPDCEEYADARRLLEFLGYFLAASSDLVPPSSILREYIGKSSFEY
jgi:uridine kinase